MQNTEKLDNRQKAVQNATLTVALITNFFNPFAMTALNIAVPHIGKEFHASTTSLTWIVLAFVLSTALLAIPFGRIADIYGRQKVLKAGILLFCIVTFLTVFSPNMAVFLVFRVLQGIGAASIFATNIAIVVDAFPPAKRGSVLGIAVAAVYVGSACGPVVGGFITHYFGWRGIFVVISALALISFIAAMARLPRGSKQERVQRLSFSSIFLYILSLGLLLYGLATLLQGIWPWFIFGAGVFLLIVFIRHELRTEVPLLEVRLFSGNRNFTFSTSASLLNYAAVFSVTYLMSIYLQMVKGYSADISGVIMIAQPVIQVILSPIAGRLSDKRSPATLATFGMVCCAGALCMFSFLREDTQLPYIIAGLLLTGFGIGFFASPNFNVIMSSVSSKEYGFATSVASTSRTVGQVVSMAVLTLIINAVIGSIPIADVAPEPIVQYVRISFMVFTAVCIVGALLSLRRRKRPDSPPEGFVEREE